jgi:hypothetical protein
MAVESTIGGGGSLFVGEGKTLRFGPLYDALNPTVGVDKTGGAMVFDVRKTDKAPDPAILSRTNFVLTGVFNSTQASNTQRATLSVTDDELNLFAAKNYRWSWKRTDPGNETVLGRGNFAPEKATAP